MHALFPLLINEFPPLRSPNTHTSLFIFAKPCHCSSSGWPAVHIHIPVVFSLDGWSQTYPLRHALISASGSGNSQLAPTGTIRFRGQTEGVPLPRAPCLTPTFWIEYHPKATRGGTLSQGPGFRGFDLYKEWCGGLSS